MPAGSCRSATPVGSGRSFEHDGAGRLVDSAKSAGSVVTSHDSAGRPVRMSLRGGPSVVASYDSAGRLGGLDLPNGVRGRFEYTDGRVSRISYSRGGRLIASQSASYDRRGRVRTLAGDLGQPELPAAQGRSTFDAAHQVTESPAGTRWRWDAAGNLLQDDTHRYQWDARGRLVGVSGPEGGTRYGYDALGRRTTSTTDGKTVRYVYDGDDVVQRVGADGTRTTYLRGPDGTPLASYTGGRVTALLPDLFGNVAAAVGADGGVRRYSYDPFGATRHAPDGPGFRGLLSDNSGVSRWALGLRPDQWAVPLPRHVGDRGWGRRPVPVRPRCADRLHRSERTCGGVRRDGVGLGDVGARTRRWLDDYDALEDKVAAGQISQDEWTVQADRVSHDLWAGFDVVANVCGTSVVGSSAAALPLLGAGQVSRVLGLALADDAVTGAASTRVGSGFGGQAGASRVARGLIEGLLEARGSTTRAGFRLGQSGFVDPTTIRFSQSSVKGTFRDGTSVKALLTTYATEW